MGILNVTPDSFSDGGRFFTPDAAIRHALEMLDEGADILDLGGESTRPTSTPISPAEEQERILPVIAGILSARPDTILSVDTYHAATARAAIEAGAEVVNDVSGHLWDPEMSRACAELGCGVILMHTRGKPNKWRTQPALADDEVVPLVLRELEQRTAVALSIGIERQQMVIDPGFGFGKLMGENFPLLANLGRLHSLGFPILAGVSRKSFLTRATGGGANEKEAEAATSIANAAAILAGAHLLRVHNVRLARETAALADRILQASQASDLASIGENA